MANFIDFIRGVAARRFGRRAVSHPHESGCAKHDPAALIESLAMPPQWNTGAADLADAYQSGCPDPA